MQDKRRNSCHDAAIRHTCGTCAAIGEEVREDWMSPDEHYHFCPTAHARIGLVEEDDECRAGSGNNELGELTNFETMEDEAE